MYYEELETVEKLTGEILRDLPTAKFSFEEMGIDVLA